MTTTSAGRQGASDEVRASILHRSSYRQAPRAARDWLAGAAGGHFPRRWSPSEDDRPLASQGRRGVECTTHAIVSVSVSRAQRMLSMCAPQDIGRQARMQHPGGARGMRACSGRLARRDGRASPLAARPARTPERRLPERVLSTLRDGWAACMPRARTYTGRLAQREKPPSMTSVGRARARARFEARAACAHAAPRYWPRLMSHAHLRTCLN